MFQIYIAINQVNVKKYIGKTERTLQERIQEHKNLAKTEHGYFFHHALQKYGFHNFKWDILEKCDTKEEMNQREIFFIQKYQTRNQKFGYNIGEGGLGGDNISTHPFKKQIFQKRSQDHPRLRGKESPLYIQARRGIRVAVLGLGMLGSAVRARLGAGVAGYDLPDWDVTRTDDLARAVAGADVIVNCVAYTDVDGAERRRDTAFRVNAAAVGELGRLAAAAGAYVVHISTDFVFDGAKADGYVETDAPNPLGAYAASKLAGERELAASGCRHALLRIQWTYGANGRNFVTKVVAQARDGAKVQVVADQIGTPTWTGDVADVIAAVVTARFEGVLHYAPRGHASRFDVARFIVDRLGLPARIEPCTSNEFVTPARRPLHSTFDCGKFDQIIGLPRPDWREPLARFLETLK